MRRGAGVRRLLGGRPAGGRAADGRLSAEAGFTLTELLVAMAAGLVVAAAAMAFLIVSIDQQNSASSRSAATTQGDAGLEQMERDLRNAMYETTASPSTTYAVTVSTNAGAKTTSMTFDIPASTGSGVTTASDGTGVAVTWTCPSSAEAAGYVGACTRTVSGQSARTLISGVQSASFLPLDSSGTAHSLSGATSSSYTDPSTIDISLDVQNVSQSDTTHATLVRGPSAPVPIVLATSADLRNFP
jgi:prepilin-type N-terminal cleavage/methylation domain-containing protein